MSEIERALREVDANLDTAVADLLELISIPSVSGEDAGKAGIARAATWLDDALTAIGFSSRVVETACNPVVLARSEGAKEGGKRLLFYGHYDVQPVAPREAWTHDPFAPEIVEEDGARRFYGRGASDSKSQLWSFIEALRAWKAANGAFPAEIVIVLEGEEEMGSPSLGAFLEQHGEELHCDVAFICDSDMWSPTRPSITTQLKGLVHETVTINAPNPDLHSGHYGAAAANPIRILSKILSSLHDEKGRVAIDGFYDDVADLTESQRTRWRELSNELDASGGVSLAGGVIEDGYTAIEAMWGRPAVDFNGITGGNQGPGGRSVLPGSATARLTFRLVAGQSPETVRNRFRNFVSGRVPDGCSVEFEGPEGNAAVHLSESNPFLVAAARGLEAEWGRPAVLKGTGGAIPVVGALNDGLGLDCVVLGFILESDAIHAPDEHYDVERLHRGTRSWIRIFGEIRGGSAS
ncbi:M20/M25/M40 family metallo-hydrolase [Roseivivax sediminis]|uniref:Acetylornithine deacetylase/Succinyl-diaminopimelate desuccinylase n=1 Tax=Roseivivax sediminis TaxID=936889 RepID=A0A1I1SXK7_9RHOB|nr:M20/M25/M40 family metallo-hydrolase [Roseivivax sediminis]SFD51177.1 Acetylornithine deacetylase/Succinyl-diaminopimelate desuccinylase [Roseivivax sediminis]